MSGIHGINMNTCIYRTRKYFAEEKCIGIIAKQLIQFRYISEFYCLQLYISICCSMPHTHPFTMQPNYTKCTIQGFLIEVPHLPYRVSLLLWSIGKMAQVSCKSLTISLTTLVVSSISFICICFHLFFICWYFLDTYWSICFSMWLISMSNWFLNSPPSGLFRNSFILRVHL